MRVTLVQMQAFLAVLEHGSFVGAANELRMSQPSVSAAIKTFEKALGGAVLNRTPYIHPTVLGGKLLPHVRATVSSAQGCLVAADSHFGQNSGSVRLAASTTACLGLVPGLLQHWRQHLPELTIQILEADDDEMAVWLEDGVVDAAILIDPPTVIDGSLMVATDSFQAVVRKDHPFAKLPTMRVSDLIDDPVIVSNSGCLPQVVEMCRDVDPAFLPAQEVRELGTLVSMVVGHVGVSIMPSLAKSMLPKELAMVPLDPPLRRNLVFTGPELRPWSPFVSSMADSLRAREQMSVTAF